jgi:hypothetical protein
MNGAHPPWCHPDYCHAAGGIGAHRTAPTAIDGFAVGLFAEAATPDTVLVEVYCGASTLAPRAAYAIGRTLMSLGRRANNGSR